MVFINANFYELHLISLLDLQANLLQDTIDLLVKDCPAVLCWKYEVVQQDCDVMAFVNVLAHLTILRRKRRGTYPLVIRPTSADPETLVFPGPEGGFVNWHNFNRRGWQKVLESLPDVDTRSPYQMRHTFCSLCREQNIPSVQLAKWAGNSAAIIDQVYAKAVENVTVPEL